MRKELEGIFRTNLDQFNLWYTLDRAPASMIPAALTQCGSAPILNPPQGLMAGFFVLFCLVFLGLHLMVRYGVLGLYRKCKDLSERVSHLYSTLH
jgi:hypothetical protein